MIEIGNAFLWRTFSHHSSISSGQLTWTEWRALSGVSEFHCFFSIHQDGLRLLHDVPSSYSLYSAIEWRLSVSFFRGRRISRREKLHLLLFSITSLRVPGDLAHGPHDDGLDILGRRRRRRAPEPTKTNWYVFRTQDRPQGCRPGSPARALVKALGTRDPR